MTFPCPIAFWIGPWPVRWYGISYGVGVALAWLYVRWCVKKGKFPTLSLKIVDGSVNWIMLGIIAGGRLGHVLLYRPSYYLHHPLDVLKVWEGGMAFHGGLLGVLVAGALYCRAHKVPLITLADAWSCGTPIGLFFGRLANFVNQELYGRVTDVPWAVIFPEVDAHFRHPSQLYEALLEGVILFSILAFLTWRTPLVRRPGFLTGVFLIGYADSRWISELFREPLELAGMGHLTLGQLYSLPMLAVGIVLCIGSWKSNPHAYNRR